MSFILTSDKHNDISLSEDEATYLLKANGMSGSKITAMKEFGESASLNSGAIMKWGNNVA